MFIKIFTLHSLTYVVGIASTIAVHQVIPSPSSPAGIRLETTKAETTTGQIANRSSKSDRLPNKGSKFQAIDKASPNQSRQSAPNPKLESDCKPPLDVIGRCFAEATGHHQVT